MASKSVILLLLFSLFSTFTFAKPSWKLVEVEDNKEEDEAQNQEKENHDDDEKDSDVKDNHDGNAYRQVICLEIHIFILLYSGNDQGKPLKRLNPKRGEEG